MGLPYELAKLDRLLQDWEITMATICRYPGQDFNHLIDRALRDQKFSVEIESLAKMTLKGWIFSENYKASYDEILKGLRKLHQEPSLEEN